MSPLHLRIKYFSFKLFFINLPKFSIPLNEGSHYLEKQIIDQNRNQTNGAGFDYVFHVPFNIFRHNTSTFECNYFWNLQIKTVRMYK